MLEEPFFSRWQRLTSTFCTKTWQMPGPRTRLSRGQRAAANGKLWAARGQAGVPTVPSSALRPESSPPPAPLLIGASIASGACSLPGPKSLVHEQRRPQRRNSLRPRVPRVQGRALHFARVWLLSWQTRSSVWAGHPC